MVSRYDVIKALKKQSTETSVKVTDDNKYVIDAKTGNMLTTVDAFVDHVRKQMHCDFEAILDMHGTLDVVYRCKECGTVIFSKEDEDYDPNLCCPTCSNYKTGFRYYTKEEIETDPEKKAAVNECIEMQRYMDEAEARREKRGKNDWEIWVKQFSTKNSEYKVSLECCDFIETKLKGLNLLVTKWGKDGIWLKSKRIPLSPYAIHLARMKKQYMQQLENE